MRTFSLSIHEQRSVQALYPNGTRKWMFDIGARGDDCKRKGNERIINWYTIAKVMVQRATNTCILFRNMAAKQVEKGYARFTADRVQIRYWTSLYLTFNKLHSRSSLNLGNCHFPFTYNEDEKTKFLVFLSKLFLNLHFSSVSNRWKRGHLFVFPHVLPFDGLLT